MDNRPELDPEALSRARERLRPVLPGVVMLEAPIVPEVGRVPNLTLAVDVLQPGGSAWVRGAVHSLIEHFGDCSDKPRVVVHGKPRWILSWGHAALLAGHPFEVLLDQQHPLDGLWSERVHGLASVVVHDHENGDALQEAERELVGAGAFLAPDVEDETVFTGLATLGAELGDLWSEDSEVGAPTKVLVGPGRMSAAVEAGLKAIAGGRSSIPVEAVHRGEFDEQERRALQEQLRVHLRLDAGPGAAAAFGLGLREAVRGGRVVVVLGG
ncbi:MAG: hypothetical protein AAF196_15325 [Planctomycetota bacterium]